jgi:hypothetical protein
MPDTAALSSTTYVPTDHAPAETFESPAPGGPYPASLGVFKGAQANGFWSLYARDDASLGTGIISNWGVGLVMVSSPAPPMISLEVPASFSTSAVRGSRPTPTIRRDALRDMANAANGARGASLPTTIRASFGATIPPRGQ